MKGTRPRSTKCEACKEQFDYPCRLKRHLETKKHKFQLKLLESSSIQQSKHADDIALLQSPLSVPYGLCTAIETPVNHINIDDMQTDGMYSYGRVETLNIQHSPRSLSLLLQNGVTCHGEYT